MTELSDHDWELVNAYADGELPADREIEVSERLLRDHALAAALSDIRTTKSALSLLRPDNSPAAVESRKHWGRRIAIVASFAAAVVAGAFFLPAMMNEDWRNAPAGLHAKLSVNTYVFPEDSSLPVISIAGATVFTAFDLSSSRLTLVDLQTARHAGRDTVAMHYRGRNGCRVTVVALEAEQSDPPSLPMRHDGLGERWSVEGFHFYILASGMDQNRFKAITAFVKAESFRLTGRDELRMAMRDATNKAKPCA